MDTFKIATLSNKAEAIKDHISALESYKYDQDYCPEDEVGVMSMFGIYAYRQKMEDCSDYTGPQVLIPEIEKWLNKIVTREAVIAELKRQLGELETEIKIMANA